MIGKRLIHALVGTLEHVDPTLKQIELVHGWAKHFVKTVFKIVQFITMIIRGVLKIFDITHRIVHLIF